MFRSTQTQRLFRAWQVSQRKFHLSQRSLAKAFKPEKITDYGHNLLPEDVEWDPPLGYQYLWLDREESATLVPDKWNPVMGVWREPWLDMFGEPAFTYGIGKEDITTRSYFDTGVTITGWQNVFPNEKYEGDAIQFGKQLVQNEIGEDMLEYLHEHGAATKGLIDSNESYKLFNRRPIDEKTPIIRGYQVSDDILVVSVNMLRYDQDSTGVFDVPPLDMFFSVDFFLWKNQGKIIKVIYECPIETMAEDRLTLANIREFSIWNYYNQRAQFKNGSLEIRK